MNRISEDKWASSRLATGKWHVYLLSPSFECPWGMCTWFPCFLGGGSLRQTMIVVANRPFGWTKRGMTFRTVNRLLCVWRCGFLGQHGSTADDLKYILGIAEGDWSKCKEIGYRFQRQVDIYKKMDTGGMLEPFRGRDYPGYQFFFIMLGIKTLHKNGFSVPNWSPCWRVSRVSMRKFPMKLGQKCLCVILYP